MGRRRGSKVEVSVKVAVPEGPPMMGVPMLVQVRRSSEARRR